MKRHHRPEPRGELQRTGLTDENDIKAPRRSPAVGLRADVRACVTYHQVPIGAHSGGNAVAAAAGAAPRGHTLLCVCV